MRFEERGQSLGEIAGSKNEIPWTYSIMQIAYFRHLECTGSDQWVRLADRNRRELREITDPENSLEVTHG